LAAGLAATGAVILAIGNCRAATDPAPAAAPAKAPQTASGPEKPAAAPSPAPAAPGTEPAAQPTKKMTLGKPDRPPSQALGAPEYDMNRMVWRTLAAALVVLVLGGLALFLMKRVMPRMGIGQGKKVAILETTYLGPQRSVHLMRVGARSLLVGATRESVRLVADVTDAFGQDPETARPKMQFAVPDLAADAEPARKDTEPGKP
jgi:flagellar biogenesis protein FliO